MIYRVMHNCTREVKGQTPSSAIYNVTDPKAILSVKSCQYCGMKLSIKGAKNFFRYYEKIGRSL